MNDARPRLGILTREERALINKRAHGLANELMPRAYNAYKLRLIEWAAIQKRETGQITMDALTAMVPDITEDLRHQEEKPF